VPDAPSAAGGTARLKARPEIEISVGGVRVELEKTTLVQLQKTVGGVLSQDGVPGEITYGLCYVMQAGERRSRLWLMSDEDMGPDHAVDSALAREMTKDEPVPSNCVEAKGTTSFKVDDQTIGSPMTDVQARLGKGARQKGGWLGYAFNARAGTDASEFVFVALGQADDAITDLYVARTTSAPVQE
jgi:hypothetical protein